MLKWLIRKSTTHRDSQSPWRLETSPSRSDPHGYQPLSRGAFMPARPQRDSQGFVGRGKELRRIREALEEESAHVVLYAERGRGKTSLANLVVGQARTAGHMVARYTCEAESDFDSIMRGLARDLARAFLAVPARDPNGTEGCEAAFPAKELRPRDVLALPGRLTGNQLMLVVDEFDRVEDLATRTAIADTIKQVSDRALPMAFLVVGVSSSLDELLGQHPSIQRNIVGVPLPLLTDAETADILERGARTAGVDFSFPARDAVIHLARGIPYVAHLLGLQAVRAAHARADALVELDDVSSAIRRVLAETDPQTRQHYDELTGSGRDMEMIRFLRELATGPQDEFGAFSVEQDAGRLYVAGVPVDPRLWRRLDTGSIVRPSTKGSRHHHMTFVSPLLRSYILLRAAEALGGVSLVEHAAAKP